MTRADYGRFDRMIPDDPQSKIHLMMSYTGDFETTFQDLLEGCEAMLNVLRSALR